MREEAGESNDIPVNIVHPGGFGRLLFALATPTAERPSLWLEKVKSLSSAAGELYVPGLQQATNQLLAETWPAHRFQRGGFPGTSPAAAYGKR